MFRSELEGAFSPLSVFVVVCHTYCFDMYRVHSFLCTWLCGASHADPTNRETTRQNTMGNGHHEKWKRGGDLKNGISAKTNSAMRASEEKSWRVWSCGLYHHAELSASMKHVPTHKSHRQADFPLVHEPPFLKLKADARSSAKPSGWTDPDGDSQSLSGHDIDAVWLLPSSRSCAWSAQCRPQCRSLGIWFQRDFWKKMLLLQACWGQGLRKSLGQQLSCKALAWVCLSPEGFTLQSWPEQVRRVLRVVLCAWLRRPTTSGEHHVEQTMAEKIWQHVTKMKARFLTRQDPFTNNIWISKYKHV